MVCRYDSSRTACWIFERSVSNMAMVTDGQMSEVGFVL